jgi:hypothetical protein
LSYRLNRERSRRKAISELMAPKISVAEDSFKDVLMAFDSLGREVGPMVSRSLGLAVAKHPL